MRSKQREKEEEEEGRKEGNLKERKERKKESIIKEALLCMLSIPPPPSTTTTQPPLDSKKTTTTKGKTKAAFRRGASSLVKLCGCCVGLMPMRPQHPHTQPINELKPSSEFGGAFTQLGPNDVQYKIRTEPKMVHQYVLGEMLGEGIPLKRDICNIFVNNFCE